MCSIFSTSDRGGYSPRSGSREKQASDLPETTPRSSRCLGKPCPCTTRCRQDALGSSRGRLAPPSPPGCRRPHVSALLQVRTSACLLLLPLTCPALIALRPRPVSAPPGGTLLPAALLQAGRPLQPAPTAQPPRHLPDSVDKIRLTLCNFYLKMHDASFFVVVECFTYFRRTSAFLCCLSCAKVSNL